MRLLTRLAVVFAGIFLLVLLVAGGGLFLAEDAVQEAYTRGAVSLAEKNILDEMTRLSHRVEDVEGQAGSVPVVDAVIASNHRFAAMDEPDAVIDRRDAVWQSNQTTQFMRERLESPLSRQLFHWAELTTDDPLFEEVIVTNRYGAVVAATGRTTDYRQDDEEWWQKTWQHGALFGELGYDESVDVIGFEISVPIRDSSGEKIGVMAALYGIDDIRERFDAIETVARIPVTAKLISGDGRLVYDSRRGDSYAPLDSVTDTDWYPEFTGASGSFIHRTQRGQELFVYAHPGDRVDAQFQDWVAVITYSRDAIFRPVDDLRTAGMAMLGLLLFVIAAAATYLYLSINRPLTSLTTVVEAISHGQLDVSIDQDLLQRDDEFGVLARAFNRTLASLKLAMQRSGIQPPAQQEDQ